jgi:6-phosphogluconolactonase (cycloisomerase 2 family)
LGLLDAYAIGAGGGALQPVPGSPFAVGPSPSAFAFDPAEHFLYVTNASTSTVSVFAINSSSGALTAIPQSPFDTMTTPTSTAPVDLVASPSGQFLYVLNSSSDNISEYSVGGNGVLTLLTGSPVTTSGTGPVFVVFDSTGKFLFVGNQGSNNITVFSVGSDGTLTSASSPSAVGASPSSMFVLP